jgi:hypothetical protein
MAEKAKDFNSFSKYLRSLVIMLPSAASVMQPPRVTLSMTRTLAG